MIAPRPGSVRWIHTAHAVSRKSGETLARVARLVLEGQQEAAVATARTVTAGRGEAPRTTLDVGALRAAKRRIRAAYEAGAEPLARLSLSPREVDAEAERTIVLRSQRFARLVEVQAPRAILEGELALVGEALERLDHAVPRARPADEGLVWSAEPLLVYAEDRSFELSLERWGGVLELAGSIHEDAGREPPLASPDELVLGRPLVELPDFSTPTDAMLATAMEERGLWDEAAERDRFVSRHRHWLRWRLDDDAEAVGELFRDARTTVETLTPSERRLLRRELASDGAAPAPEDWVPPFLAHLARMERDYLAAIGEGLVVIAGAVRSLA